MGILKNNKKEEIRSSVNIENMSSEYAGVYFIKLLFSTSFIIDHEIIFKKLMEKFQLVNVIMQSPSLSSYALMDHMVAYKDGEQAPSQLIINDVVPFERSSISAMTIQQCWTSNDTELLIDKCKYELMVSDFMAGGLPPLERYQILAEFVDVLLSLFPQCVAMYWPHAEKIIPSSYYINSEWNDPMLHFLDGGLNVRLFNIQDSEDKIVDTTGLSALGLPDLQAHFHALDLNFVISFMNNYAAYLYMNGDVIHDGETIDGINPEDKWTCQHEDSLVEPNRIVLDICMSEFASGNRNHE